jgi:catecholate siderophore receptor
VILSDATNSANNINLDPEETRSYELGTKWEFFNQRLLLSAAVFRTEKVNARTQVAGGGTVTLDGEQIVQGVEFGASGSITPEWMVFAGYAYMESEIEESNNASEVGAEFGNTPKHSFNLWTTYQLPWHVEIGGGANYVGERYNNQSGNVNVRRAPGYWLFDAMLAYEVNQNLTLRLNAYNLADERYIDRVGGGHFVPGAGRSAMLTAEFRF